MKNQQKFFSFFIVSLFSLPLLYSSASFAAVKDSCVMCHINESLMNSLHKPLPVPAGEGEG
ncbi:MAG: hypothetical protein AB2L12_10745 [Smithellaceae bacterium]